MAWTGFGGTWKDGRHEGGDDSGSIGGSSIKLDSSGNPMGTRAPSAGDIAAQYNSYGGRQITTAHVSNIRSDGAGGYHADISGVSTTVNVGGSSRSGSTLGGFTAVSVPNTANGKGAVSGGMANWNDAANSIRAGKIPINFKMNGGKIGIMAPKYKTVRLGHGEGTEEQYVGEQFVEVPSLTTAYNEGVKERSHLKDSIKQVGEKAGSSQITAAQVSNIRSDGAGGYQDYIGRPLTTVNVGGSSRSGSTLAGFTDVSVPNTADAIKLVADFYKEVGEKAGAAQAAIAKELADATKGKQIRNVEQALASFDKYKDVLAAKFSVADRQAIANALRSVDRAQAAKNLKAFGKAAGFIGLAMDLGDLTVELANGIETNNYRGFLVKATSMLAGIDAGMVTAWAFSIMLGTPIGILGYAIIMAAVSTLVNEQLVERVISSLK